MAVSDREISQTQVNQFIEDAAYLQDEADAMQYVIEEVPYDESPEGKRSIGEMLLLIDHAQTSYYRPVFEETISRSRPTHVDNFIHYEESFEFDGDIEDIQKILRKISKHRAAVVNIFEKTSLIDWESVIYDNDQQILLYDFMRRMIRFERGMLKNIANRVRVFSQDKQTRREIEKRKRQRPEASGDSDF